MVEWFSSLKLKKYMSQRTISSGVLKFSEMSSFSITLTLASVEQKTFKMQPSEGVP